jgi:protein deglycase
MITVFLADGFEEIEALTPVDILRRAGCDVKCVSINKTKSVTGAHGITVNADMTADEAEKLSLAPEMVILPGGMPGATNLDKNKTVDNFINRAAENGAYLAAICAAPMILGKRGLLKGKRATCYPGFEKYLEGADITGGRVESDGHVVTSCGMGAALEFALELCRLIKGEDTANKLSVGVIAK